MSSALSAERLRQVLAWLPSMRSKDLVQLLDAMQQRLHINQVSFFGLPRVESTRCLLAQVPVEITSTLVGSCLDDASAIAWAQCSRRSLQQLQSRPFVRKVCLTFAMELADRHDAAFGIVANVRVRNVAEWTQMSRIASSVRRVEIDYACLGDLEASTIAEIPSVKLPDTVTSLFFACNACYFRYERVMLWIQMLCMPSQLRVLGMPNEWLYSPPFELPDSVTELTIPSIGSNKNCYPQRWPSRLRILRCFCGIPLQNLPPLPSSLTELDTNGLLLQQLSLLPTSLLSLDWRRHLFNSVSMDRLRLITSLQRIHLRIPYDSSLDCVLELIHKLLTVRGAERMSEVHFHGAEPQLMTPTFAQDNTQIANYAAFVHLRRIVIHTHTTDACLSTCTWLKHRLPDGCEILFTA
jgi:hypothetical protein